MPTPLYQALVEADKAYYAAYKRLHDETDRTLFGQLQAVYDEALAINPQVVLGHG